MTCNLSIYLYIRHQLVILVIEILPKYKERNNYIAAKLPVLNISLFDYTVIWLT